MERLENNEFVYEFGKFLLDPQEKVLLSDGVPVRLPSKEFETLLLLVENCGRALSKEEMISAIWRGAFVEEGNLAKQISRLRKILNTNDNEFIETLPKHGYRFSASLRRTVSAADDKIILKKYELKRVSLRVENDIVNEQLALLPKSRSLFTSAQLVVIGFIALIGVTAAWFWSNRAPLTNAKITMIAVLPIKPLTDDEKDKALAVGLTDALITKLGSLKPLIVRPANSVSQFADAGQDPLEIGRNLKVNAVLEGAIMQAEGKLRVNIRLFDTQTGEQIWEDRFDGALTDIFDLEDRISEKAARNLLAKITGEPKERITKRYTENPEAFDAYLKGRYFWNKRSEDGFRRAIEYFNEAVAKDPNYSLAYAGLADCYILLGVWGAVPPNEAFPQAKAAAEKALLVDNNLAEAVVSLAFVEWVYGWDFKQADTDFKRAIDLNPNYALAHHWYSYYLVSMKRFDEAINEIKEAREIEGPLSLSVNTDIGEIYSWAGRYDEAEQYLQNVLQIEPNFILARTVLGINLIKQNRFPEAITELERARVLDKSPWALSVLGYAYAAAGKTEKARELANELNELSRNGYMSPFRIAIIYTGLGERDKAFSSLENAYRERSDKMAILQIYPLLDPLRSDPRFTDLEKRVGYPR